MTACRSFRRCYWNVSRRWTQINADVLRVSRRDICVNLRPSAATTAEPQRSTRTSVIRKLATFALFLLAAPLHAQSRAELEKVIRRKVLPNGLEVIVVE